MTSERREELRRWALLADGWSGIHSPAMHELLELLEAAEERDQLLVANQQLVRRIADLETEVMEQTS